VVPESEDAAVDALACHFTYPEAKKHNAEALLIAPDGALRIVTKNSDGHAKVFLADSLDCSKRHTLTEETELSLDGATEEARKVTGGAINEAGTLVVLRSYTTAWIWRGCTLDWGATPQVVKLDSQPQGEAITFDNQDDLISTSEGTPFRIWQVPCTSSEELKCSTCGCDESGGWWAGGLVGLSALRRRRR
jgi:uncharacterized protein (TIGR03382 family)